MINIEKRISAFGIGCCLLLVPFTALADNHTKDKTFIQDALHKLDVANSNKDLEGALAYTDPDFVDIDQSGKEDVHGLEEQRQKVSSFLDYWDHVNVKTTIDKITFTKEGAIIDETGHGQLERISNNQEAVMTFTIVYRDFWIKSSDGWLQKRLRTVSMKNSIKRNPAP